MLKFPRALIKFKGDPKYVLAAQIAGWCLVLGSTYYWLDGGEFHQIKEQLGRSHFWMLEINFIFMAVLGIVNVKKILTTFSISGVKQHAPLFAIVVLVIILLGISSQTNRIFYDEQIYRHLGKTYLSKI